MHQDTVQDYVESAERMLEKGQIDEPTFNKILVQFSYDYLQQDQEQRAFALLNRVNPEYFAPGGVMFQQGKADKHYAELTVKLAYRLLQLGLVGADIDLYQSTQKPAQA